MPKQPMRHGLFSIQRRIAFSITFMVATGLGLVVTPAAASSAIPSTNFTISAMAQDVTIPARRVPSEFRFVPPHIRGDRDFAGHGPDITVRATLVISRKTVNVDLDMRARETRSDWTTASGSRSYLIYTAPSARCIQGANIGTFDRLNYRDNDHEVDIIPGQDAHSFINKYSVVGDTKGNESGTRTGVAVDTKRFTLRTVAC